MIDALAYALLATAVPLSLCAGFWLGTRTEREAVRMRGENALRWLSTYPTPTVNVVPASRLVARATGLPDPHPHPTPKGTP